MASWESDRAEAARRLKRDRRELDQQARELLKLPTRKERAEVRRTRMRADLLRLLSMLIRYPGREPGTQLLGMASPSLLSGVRRGWKQLPE